MTFYSRKKILEGTKKEQERTLDNKLCENRN